MPEVRSLQPGDPSRLGSFVVTGRLGEGGQGSVYLGQAPGGEAVAIKVLHTRFNDDDAARSRFLREAATARQVARFCTAQVLAADVAGGRPYIVSEYVPGQSLHDLVRQRGARSGADLERLAISTATALAAIHKAGIVHRDFKPHNVLIGPDGPRVIDFGVARMSEGKAAVDQSAVIGTPSFMAPEQFTSNQVGPAVDVFAWGATMIFAATGRTPFEADTLPAVMHRIVYDQADVGELEQPLRDLVTAALAKDPRNRPTARDLVDHLLGADEPTLPAGGVISASSIPEPGGSAPGGHVPGSALLGGPVPGGPAPVGPAPGPAPDGVPAPHAASGLPGYAARHAAEPVPTTRPAPQEHTTAITPTYPNGRMTLRATERHRPAANGGADTGDRRGVLIATSSVLGVAAVTGLILVFAFSGAGREANSSAREGTETAAVTSGTAPSGSKSSQSPANGTHAGRSPGTTRPVRPGTTAHTGPTVVGKPDIAHYCPSTAPAPGTATPAPGAGGSTSAYYEDGEWRCPSSGVVPYTTITMTQVCRKQYGVAAFARYNGGGAGDARNYDCVEHTS